MAVLGAGGSAGKQADCPNDSSLTHTVKIDTFELLGCCGTDMPLPPSPSALTTTAMHRLTQMATPPSSKCYQRSVVASCTDAAVAQAAATAAAHACCDPSVTAGDAAVAAEVASKEAAAARDCGLPMIVKVHDIFNLLFIGLLNCQNVYYLCTGRGFSAFYMTTMLYFLADLVFVGVFPLSVKSPVVILTHHIITSVYILIPYNYPQYEWCMAACMLVEINTWLLIAKRTVKMKILEVLFYISWIGLRNIFYPYLIYAFYKEWQSETASCGSPWNPILLTPILQLGLTGLNCHWTHALFCRNKGKQQKQL